MKVKKTNALLKFLSFSQWGEEGGGGSKLRLGIHGFGGLERIDFLYYQGSTDRYSCYKVHILKYLEVYQIFTLAKHNLVA